jgi:Fungal potassium channel
VREFHTNNLFTRLQCVHLLSMHTTLDPQRSFRYVWRHTLIIKSFAVYASDIYTAIALLASNRWAGEILQSTDGNAIKVPFTIGKWIFTGCVIFSLLLLVYEARKARRVIRSRDISYAFTNVMANNYYSLKSYDHFCFFSNINDSKKKKDEFAFFIFFTFKGSFFTSMGVATFIQ